MNDTNPALSSKDITRRKAVTVGLLLGADIGVSAGKPSAVSDSNDSDELKPSKATLQVLAIGKVTNLKVLSAEEKAASRRRLSVTFELTSQIGFPDNTNSLSIRFNALSRVFGVTKDEAITKKHYLVRLLDEYTQPYDGRFEIWILQGVCP